MDKKIFKFTLEIETDSTWKPKEIAVIVMQTIKKHLNLDAKVSLSFEVSRTETTETVIESD